MQEDVTILQPSTNLKSVVETLRNLAKFEHSLSPGCANIGLRCPRKRHSSTAKQYDNVRHKVLLCILLGQPLSRFQFPRVEVRPPRQQDFLHPRERDVFPILNSEPVGPMIGPLLSMLLRYRLATISLRFSPGALLLRALLQFTPYAPAFEPEWNPVLQKSHIFSPRLFK